MVAVYGSFEEAEQRLARRHERVVVGALGLLLAAACICAVGVAGSLKGNEEARAVVLDSMMDEFDPIEDADSNYGRVIGIKAVSRTNGVITEDMDTTPERKAPLQQLWELYDLDGPKPTDVLAGSWKASSPYTDGWYKQPAIDNDDIYAVIHDAYPQ